MKITRQLTKSEYELMDFFQRAHVDLDVAAIIARCAKHPEEKAILKLINELEIIYGRVRSANVEE